MFDTIIFYDVFPELSVTVETEAAFNKFQKVYETSNSRAPDRYKLPFAQFLTTYKKQILQLYKLLGDDIFAFFGRQLGESANQLIIFMNGSHLVDDELLKYFSVLYQQFHDELLPKQSELLTFIKTLFSIDKLILTLDADNPIVETTARISRFRDYIKDMFHATTVTDLQKFSRIVLYKMLADLLSLGVPSIAYKCDKLSLSMLTDILSARRDMNDGVFRTIFITLLKIDFDSSKTFNDFITSTSQDSDLGRQIAHHNQQIRDALSTGGINTKLALQYQKKAVFTIGDNKLNLTELRKIVWQYILKLDKACLMDAMILPGTQLNSLKKKITNLKLQVTRQRGCGNEFEIPPDKLKILSNTQLQKFIQDIIGILNLLPINDETRNIRELKNQLEYHNQLMNTTSPSSSQSSGTFEVRQWDKSDILTYVLGNMVNCCLATNKGSFGAAILRRLDQAMLMHVVIDKKINEPVCATWLFFAKGEDNKIYVVAQFFEIRNGYGLNLALRDQIVDHLAKFTAEYAKKVGAAGYLIKPLTFGPIPDFKDLPSTHINISKIGGFFEYKGKQYTYNLDAATHQDFYVYPMPSIVEDKLTKFKSQTLWGSGKGKSKELDAPISSYSVSSATQKLSP